MNGAVISKLEIDVMQINEVLEATEIAHKYKLPSLVVHPGLSSEAIIARSRAGAKFNIITPIDWPKGETFGASKMRGLMIDTLETDGFEFLLTGDKKEIETKNEVQVLSDFVKMRLGENIEVRFVLGSVTRSMENVMSMCRGIFGTRTPSMIRTDINTKTQILKANSDEHNKLMEAIRTIIKAPIKVSGNFNNLKSIVTVPSAARFAVSLQQAKTIIKEFKSQPDKLNELLKAD